MTLEQRRNLVWNNLTTQFQPHFDDVPTACACIPVSVHCEGTGSPVSTAWHSCVTSQIVKVALLQAGNTVAI